MKTRAIIVDDEKMARMLLCGMISEHLPEIEIVGECQDLPSAVKTIIKQQPDLIFLDIEMPGHSGLELVDFFESDKINFNIIFTTAYNQYAIQAFKLSAIDYLLKPIDSKDLIFAYQLFEKNRSNKKDYQILKHNFGSESKNHKLAISSVGSIRYIELDDIIYIGADGAYSEVLLTNGQKITATKGLKHFEEALSQYPQFMRCQKSSIVNLFKVTELVKADGGSVVLANKYSVSISQNKFAELNQKIQDIINVS